MHVTAIIAAGGRGRRLGAAMAKLLIEIGGRAVLARSVALFLEHPAVHELIVALPPELVDTPLPYLRGTRKRVRVTAGGARRQDSVANAFRLLSDDTHLVVVHDAARPFASADLVSRAIAAAAESGAALAAIPARDTVKKVDNTSVVATLDRESIYLAQTPQAFRRDILRDALALGSSASD